MSGRCGICGKPTCPECMGEVKVLRRALAKIATMRPSQHSYPLGAARDVAKEALAKTTIGRVGKEWVH